MKGNFIFKKGVLVALLAPGGFFNVAQVTIAPVFIIGNVKLHLLFLRMKLIVISSEDLVFSVTLPTKYLLLFFPANSTKTKSPNFGLQVSIKSSSSTSSELPLSFFSDFFPNSFLSDFDAIFLSLWPIFNFPPAQSHV